MGKNGMDVVRLKIDVEPKIVSQGADLVVDAGRDKIAEYIKDTFIWCAVGSDGTTPSATDTSLLAQLGYRKQPVEAKVENHAAKFTFYFGTGESDGVWREVGLFDSAENGVMLFRTVISDFDKTGKRAVVEITVNVVSG